MIDLTPLGTFIERFGLPLFLLLIAGVTGARGQWLFRWVHDAIVTLLVEKVKMLESERDDWKEIALGGLNVAETMATKGKSVNANGTD